MIRFLCAGLSIVVLAGAGYAQPLSSQPPIIFVNGYQFSCAFSSFANTFGSLGDILASVGIRSTFYDTCSCRGCTIEQHAKSFSDVLQAYRNPDGTAPPQFDIVAHSMGGLIVRSYLAGKTSTTGPLIPPLNPRIRKVVFVASPHFGLIAPAIDTELSQMQLGSRYVWELGTWNQGTDDLRGVDAIAIAGSGGSAGSRTGLDDGLIPLTSAALSFAITDLNRTRVIPYCHNSGIPFIIECASNAPPIGRIDSPTHPTLRIIQSFLLGTDEWRSVGDSAATNAQLSRNGGIITSMRDSADRVVNVSGITANGANGERVTLSTRTTGVLYREWMTAQTYTAAYNSTPVTWGIAPGGLRPFLLKLAPFIGRVYPSAAALPFLSVAPGSLISLYGGGLAPSGNTSILLDDQALQVLYTSDTQVNAMLPARRTGLATLTVRNTTGQHSVSLMIEPAVPAVFTLDGSGKGPAAVTDATTGQIITSANPARRSQIVALYLTGLGDTEHRGDLDFAVAQPTITVGGATARILYAGRAPGYSGLDQINVEIPANAQRGDAVAVTVQSGFRKSNDVTLAIQ